MKNARRNNALLAGLTALIAGCGTPARSHPAPVRPAVLTSSEVATLRGLSTGDSAFGLNLLAAVCQADPSDNVVLSPLSVTSSLGLAYLGARGTTAARMAAAMHFPRVPDRALTGVLGDRTKLLSTLERPGITFAESNRIWADPSLHTNPSYVTALRGAYRTTLTHLPLLSDPAKSVTTINAAVGQETRGHIPQLLPSDALDNSIGWVLTNALYLKAAWASPFDPSQTKAGAFYASSGKVSAKYLNGNGFTVASDGGWTAASLPYKGNRLQMIALLPPQVLGHPAGQLAGRGCPLPSSADLATVEKKLQGSQQTASISLPKVKLSWQGSLKPELTALGMGAAFASGADFSGISPQAGSIGFVEHAATLDVGEKGTVASAATATGIEASSAQYGGQPLVFDRPYLMLIEDSKTGEPLMLAWVRNPAAS